jgi:hypothetical protein
MIDYSTMTPKQRSKQADVVREQLRVFTTNTLVAERVPNFPTYDDAHESICTGVGIHVDAGVLAELLRRAGA